MCRVNVSNVSFEHVLYYSGMFWIVLENSIDIFELVTVFWYSHSMSCCCCTNTTNITAMAKTKEHSIQVRNNVIEEYKTGKGYRMLSKQFNIATLSIQYIFRNGKEVGWLLQIHQDLVLHVKISYVSVLEWFELWKNRPRTTRQDLVDGSNTSDIKVTPQTIGNTLRREGLRKGRARKVPLLAKRHVDAQIKYANDLINKEQDCFRNILWSDECRVQLFSNNYTEIEWCQPTKKTQYLPWSIVVIASCNGNAFHLWVLNILMSSMKQWIPPSIEPL